MKLSEKQFTALNSEKRQWLQFFQAMSDPNADLKPYAGLVSSICRLFSKDNGRVLIKLFKELASVFENVPRIDIEASLEAPIYTFNPKHVRDVGDYRNETQLCAAELQQCLYMLTASNAHRDGFRGFKEATLKPLKDYMTALTEHIPSSAKDAAHKKASELIGECADLIKEHINVIENGLYPLRRAISEDHLMWALAAPQQIRAILPYVSPAIAEFANGIQQTSLCFDDVHANIEEISRKLTCLTILLFAPEVGENFEDKLSELISNPSELVTTQSAILSQMTQNQKIAYSQAMRTIAELQDTVNQEKQAMRIFSLPAQPTIELEQKRLDRANRERMVQICHQLTPDQQAALGLNRVPEEQIRIEPSLQIEPVKEETSPQNNPFSSVSKVFAALESKVQNAFAKKTAIRAQKLLQSIQNEINDGGSALNIEGKVEQLTRLIIELSVLYEQSITSMLLEEQNVATQSQCLRLVSHKQRRMIAKLNLEKNAKHMLFEAATQLRGAELFDRTLYEANDYLNPVQADILLRRCAKAATRQELEELTTEVYAFVGQSMEALSDSLASWLNISREKTSLDDWIQLSSVQPRNKRKKAPEVILQSTAKINAICSQIGILTNNSHSNEARAALANANRFLKLAIGRLARAAVSNNPEAFLNSMHRYLYMATNQLGLVASGMTDVEKNQRPDNLWTYIHRSLANSSFTKEEKEFLYKSGSLNNAVRYHDIALDDRPPFFDNAVRQASEQPCPDFLSQHGNKDSDCGKLCQKVFDAVDITSKICNSFLAKISQPVPSRQLPKKGPTKQPAKRKH